MVGVPRLVCAISDIISSEDQLVRSDAVSAPFVSRLELKAMLC